MRLAGECVRERRRKAKEPATAYRDRLLVRPVFPHPSGRACTFVLANQPAIGTFFVIELPLLRFGEESAIGFDLGVFLLLDRLIVRQKLFGFGRRQLAALQSLGNASALIAYPAIDLVAARMLLGEATSGRADRIARPAGGNRNRGGRRGGVLIVANQPAIGVLFLIDLPLLRFGQESAIGFYLGVFLLLDRLIVRQKLFRLARRQLAAFDGLLDASALIAYPAIDLVATRMLVGEATSGRADRVAGPASGSGNRRGRRGGVRIVVNQSAIGVLFLIDLPLLRFGQESAIGFDVGMLLLFDRSVVRQDLFGLGWSQLAAFQSFGNASELFAVAMIDLIAAGMVLGELVGARTGVIARPTGSRRGGVTGFCARFALVGRSARVMAGRVRMSARVGRWMSTGTSTAGMSTTTTTTAAALGEGRNGN